MFFLESLNMVILKKGKKGKNQNEKNSSHQYVHFHKIVFNGNLFSLKRFLKFIMIVGYYFVTTAPSTRYCFKLLRLYFSVKDTKESSTHTTKSTACLRFITFITTVINAIAYRILVDTSAIVTLKESILFTCSGLP